MSAHPDWDLHCAETAAGRAEEIIIGLQIECRHLQARVDQLEREAGGWFAASQACLEEIAKLEDDVERARASAIMHAEQRTGWVAGKGYANGVTLHGYASEWLPGPGAIYDEDENYWAGGA